MRDFLQSASDIYRTWHPSYLLVGHCLLVSSWFTSWKDRYLLCWWVGLLTAFGGGLGSAILLQNPREAPIAFLADNKIGLIWTVCWWLMTYEPTGLLFKLHNLRPVRLVSKVCLNTLRAGLIASRVDVAVKSYPGVLLAPLLIGTIAGSGGKLLSDGVAVACGSLKGPAEVAQPGFAAWSGFLGAAAYVATVHWLAVLSRPEGHALVATAFIMHGALVDLTGLQLDYTYPVARLVHGLTNIPMPGLAPSHKPSNNAQPGTGKPAEAKKIK